MRTRDELLKAIAALHMQREVLGETAYQTVIAALEAELSAQNTASHAQPLGGRGSALLTFSDASRTDWLKLVEQNRGERISNLGDYGCVMFDSGALAADIATAVNAGLVAVTQSHMPMLLVLGPITADQLSALWDMVPPEDGGRLYVVNAAYQTVRGVFVARAIVDDQLYEITDLKIRAFPIGHAELELISPQMIGRDGELEHLKGLFESAFAQERAFGALIVGNSGVGKSRLLLEMDKWIELYPRNVWHLEAQATETTRSVMFGLLRQAMGYRFDISERDDDATARAKLSAGVTSLLGQDAPDATHFIGQLVGYEYTSSPYLLNVRANSQLFREAAYDMLVKVLRAAAHHYNALIYLRLDDVHDSDAASLEMLQYLISAVVDFPMMIVATAQPSLYDLSKDEQPLGPNFQVINLRSLSEAMTSQLLDRIFGAGRMPLVLRRELIARTGGNPYHLEEAIRLLQDEGVLIRDQRGWRVADSPIPMVQIPTTVEGVLQARLNSLPPEAQTILQQASMVGRIFWDKVLFHLQAVNTHPIAEDTIQQMLRVLHQRGMIAPRPQSGFEDAAEYMFQQGSVHRVTYDTVRQQQAQRYHLRIAQWLIGRTREGVGENASLIAQHFARAKDIHRAIKWYALAAQQAFNAYLPERAIQYYEQAFALIPDYIDDLRLQVRLFDGYGRVLAAQGQYTDALAAYTAVCMAAEKANDLVLQAQAWNAMSQIQVNLIAPGDALDYAERALTLAERAGPIGLEQLANAYLSHALVYNSLDKPQDAIPWLEKALPLIDVLPNHHQLMARAHNLLGESYYYLNRYEDTVAANLRALAVLQQSGDKALRSRVLNDLAFAYFRQGAYQPALEYSGMALALAREYSARHDAIYFVNNHGIVLTAAGQYELAESHLYQVLRMVGPLGWWGMVGTYVALCQCHIGLSKLREAYDDAIQALEWAKRTNNAADLAIAWRMLGIVADHRRTPVEIEGRLYDCEDCFANSRRALQHHHHPAELAHTLWEWGQYLRRRDPQRARRLLQEARDLFLSLNLTRFAEMIDHDQ